MPVDLNLIEGAYLTDLLDQPQALQQTVDGLDQSAALQKFAQALGRGDYKRVVLTGMGSSLHALHSIHQALCGAGFPAQMAETSELALYMPRMLDNQTLLVVVSQSGQSAETIRMLGLTAGRVPTIGVTNTPTSPLAAIGRRSADACRGGIYSLMQDLRRNARSIGMAERCAARD